MTSSRVVGPALAGLLVSTVGYGWAFLGDGLSYLAVIAGLWMMRTSELRAAPVTPRGRGQVRAGLRYVRSEPELFVPLAMLAVIGTLSYNFQTVFPLFVTRDLDSSDAVFTALFSVVSVGSLIGALVAARRSDIGVRQVGMAAIGYGVAMAAMALAPNVAVAVVLGVVLGLASISFIVSSTAIVQLRSAPEMRGRVLAIQAMLFLGSTPDRRADRRVGRRGVRGPVQRRRSAPWRRCSPGLWGLAVVRRGAISPTPTSPRSSRPTPTPRRWWPEPRDAGWRPPCPGEARRSRPRDAALDEAGDGPSTRGGRAWHRIQMATSVVTQATPTRRSCSG